MKTNLVLLLVAALCFSLASCATPEQTIAAVAAVGASAKTLIDSLAPLLAPEDLARLQATAANIDGTVQATASAIGTLADAIANVKTAASANMQAFADKVTALGTQVTALPSREEVYLSNTGTGVAATAAARLLSHFKHAAKPA